MFGTNPLRKQEFTDGSVLAVQGDPWPTIQGEGPHAGMPATFIRMWGCHLKCHFCDTDFESNKIYWTLTDLVKACEPGPELVVITGGEPMRQNILPLCQAMVQASHRVQIETAGSFWFAGALSLGRDAAASIGIEIVVSPKGPTVDEQLRQYAVAWKYIIAHDTEVDDFGIPITNTQNPDGKLRGLAHPPLGFPKDRVYLQPMNTQDRSVNQSNTKRCIELALKFGYRVSLQQHLILGVP
jgi:7-carboxy-7-deazaguanine synthase